MLKFLLTAAAGKALGGLVTLGATIFIMNLLPLLLGFLPGFGFATDENGNKVWNFNVLSPLAEALEVAPPGLHYLIVYWRLDLMLAVVISGAVYGLVLKIVAK